MAKPNITEVGRVTVPSADQDRSIAFYTETLGFEKRVDETFANGQMRWIEVAPAGGTTAIALTPPMGEFQPGRQTGIIVSTDDIEAAHAATANPSTAATISSAPSPPCRTPRPIATSDSPIAMITIKIGRAHV